MPAKHPANKNNPKIFTNIFGDLSFCSYLYVNKIIITMKLSNAQRLVLTDLSEGWVLGKGIVLDGWVDVCYLKKVKGSLKVTVNKVSIRTVKSLISAGLIEKDETSLTTVYYRISEKGKKALEGAQ